MNDPRDDVNVTIVKEDDVEDAFEGIRAHDDGRDIAQSRIDELSVLTGEDAASFLELVSRHQDFEAMKQYCESRYDVEITVDDTNVFRHPYLSVSHSVLFTAEPRANGRDGSETLNICVYFEEESVAQVVAIHERQEDEDRTEIRVIRRSNDGFTEHVTEQQHPD